MNDSAPQVLLTGATGKIGKVLTHALAQKGYAVLAQSRDEGRASALAAEVAAALPEAPAVLPVAVDLAQPGFLADAQAALGNRLGEISAVIHGARSLETGEGTELEVWQRQFLINVMVPYQLTMALVDAPGSQLKGAIMIGSMYGLVSPILHLYDDPAHWPPLHYGASKAALQKLGSDMAVRLAPRGIRVNTISYGGVEGRAPEAFVKRYSAQCPQHRMLGDKDLAEPVLFLLSEGSSGVTGHNLVVDGGWTLW